MRKGTVQNFKKKQSNRKESERETPQLVTKCQSKLAPSTEEEGGGGKYKFIDTFGCVGVCGRSSHRHARVFVCRYALTDTRIPDERGTPDDECRRQVMDCFRDPTQRWTTDDTFPSPPNFLPQHQSLLCPLSHALLLDNIKYSHHDTGRDTNPPSIIFYLRSNTFFFDVHSFISNNYINYINQRFDTI